MACGAAKTKRSVLEPGLLRHHRIAGSSPQQREARRSNDRNDRNDVLTMTVDVIVVDTLATQGGLLGAGIG